MFFPTTPERLISKFAPRCFWQPFTPVRGQTARRRADSNAFLTVKPVNEVKHLRTVVLNKPINSVLSGIDLNSELKWSNTIKTDNPKPYQNRSDSVFRSVNFYSELKWSNTIKTDNPKPYQNRSNSVFRGINFYSELKWSMKLGTKDL